MNGHLITFPLRSFYKKADAHRHIVFCVILRPSCDQYVQIKLSAIFLFFIATWSMSDFLWQYQYAIWKRDKSVIWKCYPDMITNSLTYLLTKKFMASRKKKSFKRLEHFTFTILKSNDPLQSLTPNGGIQISPAPTMAVPHSEIFLWGSVIAAAVVGLAADAVGAAVVVNAVVVGFSGLDGCAVVVGAEFDGFSVFVGCAVVGGAVVVGVSVVVGCAVVVSWVLLGRVVVWVVASEVGAAVVGETFRLAFVSVVVGEGSVFTVVSWGVVGFRLGCGSVALGGVGGSVSSDYIL